MVCFNRLAEISEKYLHKGARIAVIGILDQQKWETEGGEHRASFQILANTLEFIKTDGRGFSEGDSSEEEKGAEGFASNAGNQFSDHLDRKKYKIDDRFITEIKGKEFVIYAGLLDLAHQMGLKRLEVTPVQYPNRDNNNESICLAVAETAGLTMNHGMR